MECTLCKTQYVSIAETPCNISSNNDRPDVSDPNAIPACSHFAQSNHDFNTHTKLTLIETKTNRNELTEVIQDIF